MSQDTQTNLIINYLPQSLTDEEFRSMFVSIGALKSSKVVRDRTTNYSYGFGFVDFTKPDDAKKAISTLNGLQLQNKRIKVAFSRQGDNIKGANLYVTNLAKEMTQTELEELFAPFGEIVQSRILTDTTTGKSKGIGFVLYNTREQAEAAKSALEGQVAPKGQDALSIKFAEDNRGKARPPPVVLVKGGVGSFNGGGYNGGHYGGGPYSGGYGPIGGGGYGPMRNQGQSRFNRFNPLMGGYGGGPNSGGSGAMDEGGFILFVYNIGPTCEERELWQLFSPFGKVQKVNVIRDHNKDQGKGFGFVTMVNYHDAVTAIQSLNGYNYAGKPLQVSFKTPKA